MTIRSRTAAALIACTLFAAPAVADSATDLEGLYVKFSDGPGSGPGGLFLATIYEKQGASYVSTDQSFWTFCVEKDEYLALNTSYYFEIYDVSKTAYAGGTNTNDGDPLSLETQWLMSRAMQGELDGFDPTNPSVSSADALQGAIWKLEQESGYYDGLTWSEKEQANDWIADAKAAVSAGYDGWGSGVQVLNIKYPYPNTQLAQSQIFYMPSVPEPGWLALAAVGLFGVVARRGRGRRG